LLDLDLWRASSYAILAKKEGILKEGIKDDTMIFLEVIFLTMGGSSSFIILLSRSFLRSSELLDSLDTINDVLDRGIPIGLGGFRFRYFSMNLSA